MDTASLVESQSVQDGYEAIKRRRSDSETCGSEDSLDAHLAEKADSKEFSIQEAIDHIGFGWFQVKLSAICGITWMAASMEIMLLSILGPVLSCEWYLEPWKQALLTTLVMAGMVCGSSFWGKVSDKYGRKTGLTLASSLIGYFGFLSAFSPMYLWMAICRFLVGCCLAALPQTVTLYSEFLPTHSRAAALIGLETFFAIGAAVEILLAMVVMPRLGWHYLMAFSALPVLFFPILSPWLPESVRYLQTSGQHKQALAMLERVAKDNGKSLPKGKLSTIGLETSGRGRFRDLYKPNTMRLSLCLNAHWFLVGFSYYGMALLLPTLLNKPDGCHGTDIEKSEKDSCSLSCTAFTNDDYLDMAITSFAEAPGLLVTYFLQLVMGRRSCMAVAAAIYSLFLFLSNICLNRATMTVFLFIARGMISGANLVAYSYTSECYPTNIRAVGLGLNSALIRVGAVITPYVAQVGTQWSAFLSFSMYGAAGLLVALFSLLLPFDTKGRAMMDSSH